MSLRPSDRRRESRHAASGVVELSIAEPVPSRFAGQLKDLSKNGFRATHSNPGLQTGQDVRFRHPAGKGSAKVMWTRIYGGQIESGFLVQ